MFVLIFTWFFSGVASGNFCDTLRKVADFEGLPAKENYALTNYATAFTAYNKVMRSQIKRLADPSAPVSQKYLEEVGSLMHQATTEVLDTFNVAYRRYTTKDGTGIRILPSETNPLGRLAKRLESIDGTRLVFAPPAYHLRDVSGAYYTKGEVGLSLQVILDFNPLTERIYSVFRLTDKELHELRHWHYDRKKSEKIVYGDATPEQGRLENYGTYAEYMSFDELFTIPYDTYLKMRPLRALQGKLHEEASFKEALAIVGDLKSISSALNPIVTQPSFGASKDLREATATAEALLAQTNGEPSFAGKNQWFFTTPNLDATGMIFDRTRKGEFEIVFYSGNLWLRFYAPGPRRDLRTIFDDNASATRKGNAMRRILERFVTPRLNMLANMAEQQAKTFVSLRELAATITNETLPPAERRAAIEKLLAQVDEMAKIPGFDKSLAP